LSPTTKKFFTGGIVFAYLLIGSGYYFVPSAKVDARRAAKEFAAGIPRKVYQYSVVPGGVTSPEELEAARRSDPVVAAHFADFGRNTRITRLEEDMYVYVSYRVGDKIMYTKTKHKVCKGEVVITDGKNYARARCANRISRVFRPPALVFDEPQVPAFDYVDPPSSPDVVPTEPLLTNSYYAPDTATGYEPIPQSVPTGANPGPPAAGYFEGAVIPPSLVPFAAGSPGFLTPAAATPIPPIPPVPPIPVTTVPEPAELPFLLGSAALLAAWVAKKKLS
jgi:hypothetical protein